MNLQIKDDMTVSELQAEFNAMFPFLKLEVKAGLAKGNTSKYLLLKQCRRQHNEGEFVVKAQESLQNFIDRLKQEFGLCAEVYRKSGNLWIATSLSNTWTLERQNNEGFEINSYRVD